MPPTGYRPPSTEDGVGVQKRSSQVGSGTARLLFPLLLAPLSLLAGNAPAGPAESPRGELVFPLDPLHNHSSSVVECPDGSLLVCWYRGSGERRADDVQILGARLERGAHRWSPPFVLADIPGFPDCNPCLYVDDRKRLWLFWVTIIANEWHTALLRCKIADRSSGPGAPRWSSERVIHVKPGPEFARLVDESVGRDLMRLDGFPAQQRELLRAYLESRRKNAADRYFSRMGWMPRARPVAYGQRLLLPLYSDGFDFSLIAYTDDSGQNWSVSEPIIGDGPVQPTLARRKDGTVVAYFRDNGPPPKRLMTAESQDLGKSWSPVRDLTIYNPGSGVEVAVLRSGNWALIHNDTQAGRRRLSIYLSRDEGRIWAHARSLHDDAEGPGAGSYSYPSLIQVRDGALHATYSYSAPAAEQVVMSDGRRARESIRHVRFTERWLLGGSAPQP